MELSCCLLCFEVFQLNHFVFMRETEGGGGHIEILIEADAFVPVTKEMKAPIPVKLLRKTIFKL